MLELSDLTDPRRQWAPFLEQHRDREIVLYCLSGARSGFAARLLSAEGFRTVNLGGLQA